ncbi:MAG: hypothetical protein K2J77_02290 [Oscillospiraceae bacterium]|nr:hypothetical protein [Oscillospiraceae bacterium]
MDCVYRDIDALPTPCGEITVVDENNRRHRFSVRKNPYSPDYQMFYSTENEKSINTDTNYLLCVCADDLVLQQTYKICLTGTALHYGDSDEHTEAVSGTANGYSIAIGAYDPNDDEKIRQAYEYSSAQGYLAQKRLVSPPQYDESRFEQYDVEMLEDYSGFSFRLLERSVKEITFRVAWVKHNEDVESSEYEAAVELWTT